MSEEEKIAIEYLKARLYGNEGCELIDVAQSDLRIIIKLVDRVLKGDKNWQEIYDDQEENIREKNNKICEYEFIIEELKKELVQEKEKNKELEKQINLNKKTVEIAQTQILEYSQGYKDGLNKETTATAIVARELELNFIRQEIKHKYISKDKLKFILSKLNISDIEPWSTYKIDGQILFDLQELL